MPPPTGRASGDGSGVPNAGGQGGHDSRRAGAPPGALDAGGGAPLPGEPAVVGAIMGSVFTFVH